MESLAVNLFGNIYHGRRVLLTGHTGFKGSWLALWLQALGAKVTGLALDPDTAPSHWAALRLKDVADCRVDLRDATGVQQVLDKCKPEIIFHLAAQPLVRRSYSDPASTFASNVTGLINLLQAVRQCPSVHVLVNATTDKVYREYDNPNGYGEADALGGHDPYSTSKACAELVTDCWRKSYFGGRDQPVHTATVRAGNVFGGGDWAEDRLVPDLVRAATSRTALRTRNPAATRPWQHVLEPLSGYLRLGQLLWNDAGFAGAWNFGPGRDGEVAVGDLVARFQAYWPALQVTQDEGPHPREAEILRLDTSKARQGLMWRPVWSLNEAASHTARWYQTFHDQGRVTSQADIAAYVDSARHQGLPWAA